MMTITHFEFCRGGCMWCLCSEEGTENWVWESKDGFLEMYLEERDI
jgi:hypothetical protein